MVARGEPGASELNSVLAQLDGRVNHAQVLVKRSNRVKQLIVGIGIGGSG